MSMFDILDNAKEIVCLAGGGGILWSDVASQLSISNTKGSPIAFQIIQRLRQSNYSVKAKLASTSSSSLSTHDEYLIIASLEDRYRAVGE